MSLDDNRITYFAETDYRNEKTKFGIKAKDRSRHVYVIGKTGMGKSTLLENLAIQDIQNGEGLTIMDPHGSFAEKMLDYIPEHRIKDVIYFAPFDTDFPVSFNVMEDVGADKRHLVASGLMSTFKKIWVDAWSARMEYILNNILLALLESPGSTLLGVNRMLADKDYRKKVVENISDPSVKAFWTEEFAKYNERYMQEAGAAIQNKVGQFTANPIIRNIVGQPHSSFDIRQVMDEKKILIANLSKGRIGEQNANLLGGMLVTKVYLGAMSRADVRAHDLVNLPHFYLYVDEFQSFANDSFADILSEARKYKLNLTIAHQYIEQMPDTVRAAVFGNVGTMIIFRVGSYDAEIFEKEFSPNFTRDDIVNLGFTQIYLRLMIDGIGSKPFSGTTLAPITSPPQTFREQIIASSRLVHGKPRVEIEEAIKVWHAPIIIERPKRDFPTAPRDLSFVRDMPQRPEAPIMEKRLGEKIKDAFQTEKPPQRSFSSSPQSSVRPSFRNQSEPYTASNRPYQAPAKPKEFVPDQKDIKKIIEVPNQNNKEVAKPEVLKPSYTPPPRHTPVSLNQLKPNVSLKDPTPQNLSILRAALDKIKTQNTTEQKNGITDKPKIEATPPQKKISPEPVAADTPKKEDTTAKEESTVKKPSREVPEEVLRKILER